MRIQIQHAKSNLFYNKNDISNQNEGTVTFALTIKISTVHRKRKSFQYFQLFQGTILVQIKIQLNNLIKNLCCAGLKNKFDGTFLRIAEKR